MSIIFQIIISAILSFSANSKPKEQVTYHVVYVDSKGFASASVTTNIVIDQAGLNTIKAELQRRSKNPDTSAFVILNVLKLPIQ